MKHVLWLYGLLLVVLLATSVVREGFESTPEAIKEMPNKKVLLLFTMNDCPHCEKLKPAWAAVSAKYPDKMVAVEKSNPAANELITKFNLDVKGYPTMFVMDHGKGTPFDGRSEEEIRAEVASL